MRVGSVEGKPSNRHIRASFYESYCERPSPASSTAIGIPRDFHNAPSCHQRTAARPTSLSPWPPPPHHYRSTHVSTLQSQVIIGAYSVDTNSSRLALREARSSQKARMFLQAPKETRGGVRVVHAGDGVAAYIQVRKIRAEVRA